MSLKNRKRCGKKFEGMLSVLGKNDLINALSRCLNLENLGRFPERVLYFLTRPLSIWRTTVLESDGCSQKCIRQRIAAPMRIEGNT